MATLVRRSCNIRGLIGISKASKQLNRVLLHRGPPKTEFVVFQSRHLSSKNNNDDDKGGEEIKHTSLWEQLQSPPNIITLTRIASTPVLAYWITSEQYVLAVWGCAIAGLSDVLDGYLAKTYNWGTTVGMLLIRKSYVEKVLKNSL